jgi:hypothetical protein
MTRLQGGCGNPPSRVRGSRHSRTTPPASRDARGGHRDTLSRCPGQIRAIRRGGSRIGELVQSVTGPVTCWVHVQISTRALKAAFIASKPRRVASRRAAPPRGAAPGHRRTARRGGSGSSRPGPWPSRRRACSPSNRPGTNTRPSQRSSRSRTTATTVGRKVIADRASGCPRPAPAAHASRSCPPGRPTGAPRHLPRSGRDHSPRAAPESDAGRRPSASQSRGGPLPYPTRLIRAPRQ